MAHRRNPRHRGFGVARDGRSSYWAYNWLFRSVHKDDIILFTWTRMVQNWFRREEKIMILGLDISTSITGYTILDDEGSVIEIGHIDLRKQKDFFDKARACQERFQELDRQSKSWIKKIYIEQSLQSFRSGFSSAQTLSLLSRFNGVLSWICSEIFDTDPEYLAAASARKLVW